MRRTLALAAAAILLSGCAPRRPDTAPRAAAADISPEVLGGVRRLGSSWVAKNKGEGAAGGGILVGRFAGAPYDLGFSFGRLTHPWMRSQETHLERLFTVIIPGGFKRSLVRQLSAFRLRGLPDEVPDDLLVSISGLADGYESLPPASGWNAYRRMLDLHALHDVSQRFVDAPALAAACTGFLAKGADGSLLLARNFDFEGGDIFDRQKLVSVVVPEGKIPYLSVGFPGMRGVVSGWNAYRRRLDLHALHDVSQRFVDAPALAARSRDTAPSNVLSFLRTSARRSVMGVPEAAVSPPAIAWIATPIPSRLKPETTPSIPESPTER